MGVESHMNAEWFARRLSSAQRCFLGVVVTLLLGSAWLFAVPAEVPVIDGGLGPCTADFTVLDSSNQPVYDAKIHVTIRYGFMSKRKTDLEIGTDSGGQARFVGLPTQLKKPPMVFTIRSDNQSKSVSNDPAANCHAKFAVTLDQH